MFTCRVLGFVNGLVLDCISCGRGAAINLWGWRISSQRSFSSWRGARVEGGEDSVSDQTSTTNETHLALLCGWATG
jgi:hypothetical protein